MTTSYELVNELESENLYLHRGMNHKRDLIIVRRNRSSTWKINNNRASPVATSTSESEAEDRSFCPLKLPTI